MSNITVRASSWGSLFDCAFRWEGEHLLSMKKASGLRAALGTAIHAGTAVYDKAKLEGESVSIDDAAGVMVEKLHKPEYDVDYSQDDITPKEAELIGLKLHTRYCTQVSPSMQFVGVENSLEPFPIDCGGGITVTLTGTMDRARLVRDVDGLVIPDIKTGARVIEKGAAVIKGRSAQLGTYQLMVDRQLGERTAGAQIVALQTTAKADVQVSPIFDARRVMVGTEDYPGLIQYAAEMFRSGLFPPNPQSMLCSPKYCARFQRCPYHD